MTKDLKHTPRYQNIFSQKSIFEKFLKVLRYLKNTDCKTNSLTRKLNYRNYWKPKESKVDVKGTFRTKNQAQIMGDTLPFFHKVDKSVGTETYYRALEYIFGRESQRLTQRETMQGLKTVHPNPKLNISSQRTSLPSPA